ncbi:MAG: hypothetical protein ACOCUI_00320 [bacterium]
MKTIKLKLRQIGFPEDILFSIEERDEGLSQQLNNWVFKELLNSKETYSFIDKEDEVLDLSSNLAYFTLLSCNAKKITSVEPLPVAMPCR